MHRAIVVILLSLGLSAIGASETIAEIEGLQLEVDGLSCPFCVIGLNKNLKKRAGLEDIEVHLREGVTEAKLPPGQGIDIEKIHRGIKEAGFTLRGIKLTVIGHVIRDERYFVVSSRGDGTRFLLFDSLRKDDDVTSAVVGETLQKQFEQAESQNQLIKMSGRVHEHEGLPPALKVETLEILPE